MATATRAAVAATRTGRALEARLAGRVAGRVRADRVARMLWSTDASIYQIVPQAVLVAAEPGDVAEGVRAAAELGTSVTMRGAASSLAGQTVGAGLIVDVSGLDRIVALDPVARTAVVQPGVVQAHLDAAAQEHGLVFGPDTSTARWATLGGMIGNNSAGMRSVVYGLTADRVRSLRCVLADGSEATFENGVALAEAERRAARPGLEGRIYAAALAIRARHATLVADRFPTLLRRVSGYALPAITAPDDTLDLARLLCGSEGTLACVVEATLGLDPEPAHREMAIVGLATLEDASKVTNELLALGPSGVELFDRFSLDRARATPAFAGPLSFMTRGADPAAILMVELSGERDDVAGRLADLRRDHPGAVVLADASQRERAIALRRAVLPLLLGVPGQAKPAAFVEDVAVDPARLGEFLPAFNAIMADEHTTAAMYGHASVGCLHARPLLDLKGPDGIRQMRRIAGRVHALVADLGGSLSGEHGDGLSRSEFLPVMYGEEVVAVFGELKDAFDPARTLNPHKIVDPEPMDTHLRYGVDYRPVHVAPLGRGAAGLSFAAEGGLAGAVELCNGSAVCVTTDGGTMCPPYQATGDEALSTRARANALRSLLDGSLAADAAADPELRRTLDTCVGCKACKTACPSGVDLASLKADHLQRRHAAEGVPRRTRLIAETPRLLELGRRLGTARLAGPVGRTRLARRLAERLVGIDRRRPLPTLAPTTFRRAFAAWSAAQPAAPAGAPRVALFADTWTEHQHPEIGLGGARVLAGAGAHVTLSDHGCCGRTYLSNGLVDRARVLAARNVDRLYPLAAAGVDLVGFEPSCILTLRDDYARLLVGDPRVAVVAARARLFEEVVVDLPGRPALTGPGGEVVLHGHCHQKAIVGTASTEAALALVPGTTVRALDAGCCGMAGGFGYETEHYALSMRMAERRLLGAVRDGRARGATIVAGGVSCREQIADGARTRARHPAEFLADHLTPGVAR